MGDPNSRVAHLPPATISLNRSQQQVPSWQHAVAELVANSIDAHATLIEVRIDPRRLDVVVEDDGCGILPASFPALATPAHTSKASTAVTGGGSALTMGFKGQALAALAVLSTLKVTSRAGAYTRWWCAGT